MRPSVLEPEGSPKPGRNGAWDIKGIEEHAGLSLQTKKPMQAFHILGWNACIVLAT